MNKDLVGEKEEIKCNNMNETIQKCLTLIIQSNQYKTTTFGTTKKRSLKATHKLITNLI